ncbi:MAG: phosphatase PAP2 family protein [Prevotellaceae bacterium]|jgi:undecaprenyl-diphosphatase|nr:phosphatase PAP2 family protein [Prevotellaceae bacterium]
MLSLSVIDFPSWDAKLFAFLNGLHVDWLDPIMVAISSVPIWIPLYLVIGFFIFKKYKWNGLICIAAAALCIVTVDQMSTVIKYAIERPRPCNALVSVHLLEGCGSGYSFLSNHASNVFGFAMITALFFKKRPYAIFIFIWAFVVAYSRIYLGKHYPLDIIGGAAFGMFVGGGYYLSVLLYRDVRNYLRLGKILSLFIFRPIPRVA